MKGTNFLIVVLFILVIASGGYMGYLIYTQNNVPTEVADVIDTPGDNDLICVDNDGDGYGANCVLGEDCDDENSELNVSCTQLLDATLALSLVEEKESVAIDEEFLVNIKAEDIPGTLLLDTLELRMSYNGAVVEYLGQKNVGEGYTALDLEQLPGEVKIDIVNPDGIQNLDDIIVLKFKGISDGLGDIRVVADTRVGVEYEVKGGTLAIVIGSGSGEAEEPVVENVEDTSVVDDVPVEDPALVEN